MTEDDRVVFVQTFSKNWAMTGWRLGWLEAPPSLGQVIENLVQYSTSGTPVFVQRGGVAALEQGEAFVEEQIERARARTADRRQARRERPCRAAAARRRLLRFSQGKRGVGLAWSSRSASSRRPMWDLAPGSAFGEGGEGYLRMCFARNGADVEEAVVRLLAALEGF